MDNSNEDTVVMVKTELVLEKDLIDKLIEFAKKEIIEDEQALLNWAVQKILQEAMESE